MSILGEIHLMTVVIINPLQIQDISHVMVMKVSCDISHVMVMKVSCQSYAHPFK